MERLSLVISAQVNKKIENMERCFRRRLKALEMVGTESTKSPGSVVSNHLRSISIDLSNKENLDPNMGSSIISKHSQSKAVQRGQIQCKIKDQIVDIDVRRIDDPTELARRVLLQRGLGLVYLDKLAASIKSFQKDIFA